MSIADYYREHQLLDMTLSEESDKQYAKRPYWHTINSMKVWIDEMDTLHISNALAHLESRSLGSCREAEALRTELKKRGLGMKPRTREELVAIIARYGIAVEKSYYDTNEHERGDTRLEFARCLARSRDVLEGESGERPTPRNMKLHPLCSELDEISKEDLQRQKRY